MRSRTTRTISAVIDDTLLAARSLSHSLTSGGSRIVVFGAFARFIFRLLQAVREAVHRLLDYGSPAPKNANLPTPNHTEQVGRKSFYHFDFAEEIFDPVPDG